MPFNLEIDERIRGVIKDWSGTDAKKMFGGVCYLLSGNMVCGVYKEFLILRLGVGNAEVALKKAHVRPFDITGRVMKGWVMVAPEGFERKVDLEHWLDQARRFVKTLPAK
jgi:hypothetical protein